MRLKIDHHTRYEFSQPVFLEPHLLRLTPVTNQRQKLLKYKSTVDPKPSGANDLIDQEGNLASQVWFDGKTSVFEIRVACTMEMSEYYPYGFLFFPGEYSKLAFAYPQHLTASLSSYLIDLPFNRKMKDYVAEVKNQTEDSVIPFLTNLTNRIYHDFEQESREIGEPFPPEKTFELKKGSCRDLVWMLISMARRLGFAARFASGYLYSEENHTSELHAWAELYLMGGGWIGLDPTSGLGITQDHILVSASANPGNTLPVIGNYRGEAVSQLKTKLTITEI